VSCPASDVFPVETGKLGRSMKTQHGHECGPATAVASSTSNSPRPCWASSPPTQSRCPAGDRSSDPTTRCRTAVGGVTVVVRLGLISDVDSDGRTALSADPRGDTSSVSGGGTDPNLGTPSGGRLDGVIRGPVQGGLSSGRRRHQNANAERWGGCSQACGASGVASPMRTRLLSQQIYCLLSVTPDLTMTML
jgi:hypothetical protein